LTTEFRESSNPPKKSQAQQEFETQQKATVQNCENIININN